MMQYQEMDQNADVSQCHAWDLSCVRKGARRNSVINLFWHWVASAIRQQALYEIHMPKNFAVSWGNRRNVFITGHIMEFSSGLFFLTFTLCSASMPWL